MSFLTCRGRAYILTSARSSHTLLRLSSRLATVTDLIYDNHRLGYGYDSLLCVVFITTFTIGKAKVACLIYYTLTYFISILECSKVLLQLCIIDLAHL